MPYAQFTLAQMRTLAYQRLGTNTAFFRTDEMDRYIREALRIWNVMSGYWRAPFNIGPTVVDQVWYPVPNTPAGKPGMSYVLRAEWNQKPLGSSSVFDLDYGQPGWESETTASGGNVPSEVEMWAPNGLNFIALWPADHAGGNSLVLEGVVPAPQPALDGDFVDMGTEELDQVLAYVAHIALFKEGGQEFEASQELLKGFLKGAATRNSMLMQSSCFRRWMGLPDTARRPLRARPETVGVR